MSTVRLRYFAAVNPATQAFHRLPENGEVDFLPMESVWPSRWRSGVEKRSKAHVSTGYTRFQDGDVLVPKITPTFEAGRSILVDQLVNGVGTGTTELHVLRPYPHIDGRFLCYVTQSHDFLKIGESQMFGVAGQQRVPDDFVRDFPIRVLKLDEQRRIADFLDAETARIENLSAVVRAVIQAASERALASFTQHAKDAGSPDLVSLGIESSGDWPAVPLSKLLTKLTNGYVGPTRDILIDEPEVRYIQSLHVKGGRIDFERRPYYVEEMWAQERPRILLATGDLVMVQTGAVGEVALIDKDHDGASCHALLILRANPAVLDRNYLFQVFRSHWGRSVLEREQTGALHPHLEAGKVRDIIIPIPSLVVQRQIAASCDADMRFASDVCSSARRQLDLLAERRQALITAAVEGQIDVTTARGFDPSEGGI